ncbi:geranylgeranyl diphosphate reductase [Ideonella sp. DXS29W]|uniref:geranylgeranyl diphosphate reductase n=1 Tax=Ideonella lacteola TaxID=2984193 RepID=A0ABU9BMU8_9BURK
MRTFDAVVVGGGPAGATAATDLARQGFSVLLLDRAGRIKPCGGAVPPRLMEEFEIPEALLVARVTAARMVAPSDRRVDMPIVGGYIGMVDRDTFDEWLRARAAEAGATRRDGSFVRLDHDAQGRCIVRFRAAQTHRDAADDAADEAVQARLVIGADGARSEVARQAIAGAERGRFVFAYHEIVQAPTDPGAGFEAACCQVHYKGALSPDFYGWVFPHGETVSVGTGSADKGFSLRGAVSALRREAALAGMPTLRREGAPIPMKPLPRWDNGRDVLVAGDAAGVVAPASGEGIYYAMASGRMAAEAGVQMLRTGDPRALRLARRRFMRAHGRVFWILGILQHFWYRSDGRRERFVGICRDRDVQQLTFDAYMHKRLVRARPMAHVRIFFKDLAHLLGLATA